MNYHVLIPDNVDPAAIDLLEDTKSIVVTAPGKMTRAETLAAIPEADALIIRSATKADAELLMAAPKLKVIARAGVGVDNIDLKVATERGVVVMNTPRGNTIAAAELTFELMLALTRQIPPAHRSMQEHKWERKRFMGTQLYGKTLGIIGLGRIGRALATRALAFEMTVIAHDPFVPAESGQALGVPLVSLDDLYERSDFISLHALVTDETREMINKDSIARMKPGVRLVNAARGALVNEADLADAIKSGHVAGVGVDVYVQEPPPDDHPLIGLEMVVHTPHIAASTFEAQIAVAEEAAELIIAALLRGEYQNVVNPAVLEP